MISHTCEWCKTTYPDFDKTENYYECIVFGDRHIICDSCLRHLSRIVEVQK